MNALFEMDWVCYTPPHSYRQVPGVTYTSGTHAQDHTLNVSNQNMGGIKGSREEESRAVEDQMGGGERRKEDGRGRG